MSRIAYRLRPRARALALLALALAALAGSSGCIGAVAGTIIDTTQTALQYPVHEYVFAGAYKYDNDDDAPWRQIEDDVGRDYGNELVGVAVSGGGSRAAYFLACVLDEMRRVSVPGEEGAAERTLLDEIDYVSSVSGGSLSSAYYVLKRPASSEPEALDAFFAGYREDMRKHFELRSLGRILFLFRWAPLLFTYYHRGHVMASVWDANFFDDATFADLPEPGGPHPSLIINATSYSSGHKFLFSRLPAARFNGGALFTALRGQRLNADGYDLRHRPLLNEGFDTIDSDIGGFKLSLAVIASAGVPNLLGPVVLKDRSREDAFVQLGDGGIYDNYGLETLVQLFTRILEERPGTRARIIVVDGSGFFPVETRIAGYSVASYTDRTSTIAWLRAADYAEPFFGSLGAVPMEIGAREVGTNGEGAAAARPYSGLRLQVVSLYHRGGGRDDEQEPDAVDKAVGAVVDPVVGFIDQLNASARAIGTRFKLEADDATTIEAQATLAVRDVLAPGD